MARTLSCKDSFPATRPSWALPWATCHTRLSLPSLQWNFIQAGAAKALGQALQLNRSLTSLE